MAGKYYAVRAGKKPGIYYSWDECKAQVDGYSGASYKGFKDLADAKAFIGSGDNVKDTSISDMVAYVDGSYNVATKEFSYGMVIMYQGQEHRFSQKVTDDSLVTMRNVAGEIKGAEAAMRYALEHGCKSLDIYYDYEGISKWCLGEWKTNKEGTIAYKKYYDSIKDQLNVRFFKVKGHSGDEYNEIADQLAKAAIFK